ncbi:RHS repeat-associated core domain-containing protein [Pseudomonas sp. C32]|uniref:RHS repeat-associated core domain-containing protein n=1 Tax=Pseudomonas sp. C32 TaxID=1529208 RepID=UPI002613745B|nr:RHS repeat-associated core domain-containing protein [Pseudomonas sp. C32]MDN4543673.1 RHS repeat-associated core domain-containing protein [Pseudomonas sp. C32]
MPTSPNTLLCQYRYDPLDRLIGQMQSGTPVHQRFYCKSRLATEIQGATRRSIVQAGDQLLAQQQRQGDVLDTTLLATDLQRSVLQTIKPNHPPQPIAYSPYGHHPAESGLTSLLGFNGERWDPVTGCYLLGNGYRAFNPVLMRFNSPDSLSPFGKGGFNSYAYCLGDPVNFFDPNGHWPTFKLSKLMFWKSNSAANIAKGAKTTNPTNRFNYSDFLDLTSPSLSPEQLAKQQKFAHEFGSKPGRQLESLANSRGDNAIEIWDQKHGLHYMRGHAGDSIGDSSLYDVISSGLRGELNGVLPSRAMKYSIQVSEGTEFLTTSRKLISKSDKFWGNKINMARQNEIYRQADVPLPDIFRKHERYGYISVKVKAKKIRFKGF